MDGFVKGKSCKSVGKGICSSLSGMKVKNSSVWFIFEIGWLCLRVQFFIHWSYLLLQ